MSEPEAPPLTLRGAPVVMSPGKIFLVGEYAVLEGGTAVLAAVSRHAVAQYLPGLPAESPLISDTVKRAVEALGDLARAVPAGSALVNTAAFRHQTTKLGLGSSAAAAAAATGAVFAFAGVDIGKRLELVFGIADDAHRASQGGVGSGADVAAAVYGGVLAYARPPGDKPVIRPLELPDGLQLVVFWTGEPASTPALVEAVRAFALRSPSIYEVMIDEMRQTAERFVEAFQIRDAAGAIEHADLYGYLLEKLGASAQVAIVTPPFLEAAALARTLGGTAKPSGAGGGDVGVALFADAAAAAEFRERCPAGVSVLDVSVEPDGIRRRRPPRTVELK